MLFQQVIYIIIYIPMLLNVKIENKAGVLEDERIDSKDLDSKIHKLHTTWRDFTAEEVRTLKAAK